MYLPNKYTTWYNNIINSAKNRDVIVEGYVEKHHIIPKSLGGSNEPDNLVYLTAREHYICHLLLTKMVSGKARRSMCYALWGMVNQRSKYQQDRYQPTSRLYLYAKEQSAISLSQERKGKSLEDRFGIIKAENIRKKFKNRRARSSPSPEELTEISDRVKLASKEKPWKRNFETSQLARKQCPVCMRTMDIGNFSKYKHGEECKKPPVFLPV